MVKPYHEHIASWMANWGRHPHQGWAEMTNQALYHAGGIGDLHQKVHVAEHNMSPEHSAEPALVIKMDPGYATVGYADTGNLSSDAHNQLKADAHKIAAMDFLTNNLDRHIENLLVNPNSDNPRLLAIDHGRSFQYVASQKYKEGRVKSPAWDDFGQYIHGHPYSGLNRFVPLESEHWKPTFDWWGQNSGNIRDTMRHRLGQIKDPKVKKHILRNFNERANHLDDLANYGIDKFGENWHNHEVRIYPPGYETAIEKE
jgi:hypothetical protein